MTTPVEVLRAGGLGYPELIVSEAAATGLDLAGAAALVQKETGGKNIYGHDPVATGGTYVRGGLVTRANYEAFRRWQRGGSGRMQGVGPVQLTYYSFQDQADALGGCWDPRWNLHVGFALLVSLQKAKGEWAGAKAYNGSGSAADAYANDWTAKRNQWRSRLAAVTPPTDRPTLRRGDTGPAVHELQVVLSRWYPDLHLLADGDFGPATERAVRQLQTRAGLTVDGVAGPATYRVLGM